jgi:hypothetical protein
MKADRRGYWQNKQFIFCALAIIPAAIYFFYLLSHITNTPYHDDFYDVLAPLILYQDSTDITGSLKSLFWQYHQHYMAYNRLVYWAHNLFTPIINFKTIIIIGNFSLVALFLQLCINTRKQDLFILPLASAIFFNLYTNESTFWAMTAVQNLAVVAFTFAALQFLYSGKSIFSACIFSWMAAFTQSNGILIIPLGFILLIAAQKREEKCISNKDLLLWIASSAACLTLFYAFENVSKMDRHFATLSPYHTDTPIQDITINFLASLASLPFKDGSSPLLGAILGAIHFPIIGFFIWRSWKNNRALSLMLVFCALSLLSASIMRTPHQGPTAFVSRYKILCTTILTIEMLLLPQLISSRKAIMIPACIFALCINAYSYFMNSEYVKSYTFFRQQQLMEWFYSGDITAFALANAILDDAYNRGMYNPGRDIDYDALPTDITEAENCPAITDKLNNKTLHLATKPYSRGALIWSNHPDTNDAPIEPTTAIWLCGEKAYKLFPGKTVTIEMWSGKKKDQLLILEKNRFLPGSYQVLVETRTGVAALDTPIDTLATPATPKDCATYKEAILDMYPLLYERYCKQGGGT